MCGISLGSGNCNSAELAYLKQLVASGSSGTVISTDGTSTAFDNILLASADGFVANLSNGDSAVFVLANVELVESDLTFIVPSC